MRKVFSGRVMLATLKEVLKFIEKQQEALKKVNAVSDDLLVDYQSIHFKILNIIGEFSGTNETELDIENTQNSQYNTSVKTETTSDSSAFPETNCNQNEGATDQQLFIPQQYNEHMKEENYNVNFYDLAMYHAGKKDKVCVKNEESVFQISGNSLDVSSSHFDHTAVNHVNNNLSLKTEPLHNFQDDTSAPPQNPSLNSLSSASGITQQIVPWNNDQPPKATANANYTTKMPTQPNFYCNICLESFLDLDALTLHSKGHKEVNSKLKAFKCRFCPRAFMVPEALDNHEQNKHLNLGFGLPKKKFYCNICWISFLDLPALTLHSKVHRDVNPTLKVFKCRFCQQAFMVPQALVKHEQKKHLTVEFGRREKWPNCSICRKKFFTKSEVKAHKKLQRCGAVECHFCQKQFATQHQLDRHIASKGYHQHKCRKCGCSKLGQFKQDHEFTNPVSIKQENPQDNKEQFN